VPVKRQFRDFAGVDHLPAASRCRFEQRRGSGHYYLLRNEPHVELRVQFETVRDPQFRHNNMLLPMRHPVVGEYTVVNNPIRFERTPARPQRVAPRLGEHTREVLAELGFDSDAIDSLFSRGTVRG